MARKKKHEEHVNHERWLVSYADFITLLFAFFVVMYSVSSVNEGKYRVLSDALAAAFRASEKALRPIQVGSPARAPKSAQNLVQKAPGIIVTPNPTLFLDEVDKDKLGAKTISPDQKKILDILEKMGGVERLKELFGDNLEGLQGLTDNELKQKMEALARLDSQGFLKKLTGEADKEALNKLSHEEIIDKIEALAKIDSMGLLDELAKNGGLEALKGLSSDEIILGLEALEKLGAIDGVDNIGQLKDLIAGQGVKNITKIADEVEQAMSGLIQQDLIGVERSYQWIEVEIKSSILYPSGSAKLQPKAIPVLEELARILKDFPNPMRIEGFTDNNPINTIVYPSNWELSTARAARVVRLFYQNDIDPLRMAAIGYGEFRPIADNTTAEGRAKNRRVVLVILANRDIEELFSRGIESSGERTAGFNDIDTKGTDAISDTLALADALKNAQIQQETISEVMELKPVEVIMLKSDVEGSEPIELRISHTVGSMIAPNPRIIPNLAPNIAPNITPVLLPRKGAAHLIDLPINISSPLLSPPIKFLTPIRIQDGSVKNTTTQPEEQR